MFMSLYGKLSVTNGTYAIRIIGDLDIGIDIDVIQSSPTHYGDAIVANNLKVSEGTKLNVQSNGSGLYSYGNIYLQKADVTINANIPGVGKGIAIKRFISAYGGIHIDNSKLDLTFTADRDICDQTGGSGGIYAGNEISIYNDSDVSVKGNVKQEDSVYVSSISGITADGEASVDRSRVTIEMDCAPAFNVMGFFAGMGGMSLSESIVSSNVEGNGMVYGVDTQGELDVQDANIEVNVKQHKDYIDTGAAYGILAADAVIDITKPEISVSSSVDNGLAFGCFTGTEDETPAEYTEGYEAEKVRLVDKTVCVTPEDNTVNFGNVVRG